MWQNYPQLYEAIAAQFDTGQNLEQHYLSSSNSALYGYRLSTDQRHEFIFQLGINSDQVLDVIIIEQSEGYTAQEELETAGKTNLVGENFGLGEFLWLDGRGEAETDGIEKLIAQNMKQQQFLVDLTQLIRRSSQLKIIFDTVTQSLTEILASDRASIVRLTTEKIVVESQFWTQDSATRLTQLTAADFYPIDLESRPIIQGSQFQLSMPILLEQGLESMPHYPLWGWLIVERTSINQWDRWSPIFLHQLSIQLSIALSQKQLYQQLQRSNQQLQASQISNQRFKQLSLKDPLTKVYNRRYFEQQLHREWFRLRRTYSDLSIILSDVDYFKLFNDTYGHQEGDTCLKQVAQTISATLKRSVDIVARYGGEEFVIILPNTDQVGAAKVAEDIRTAISALEIPHPNSPGNSVVTVSLGVATTIPQTQSLPEMLLSAADKALYLAKNRGRDRVAIYEPEVVQVSSQESDQDREWTQRIRYALEHDLFHLYAQPIKALKEEGKNRFEILLRLEDRAGEVFPPSCFLEIAQRNYLMSNIDTWVIDRLLSKLMAVGAEDNWQNYQFSVNLSGASLKDRQFLDFLSIKLGKYQLPPQLLCFEITEGIAIDNIQHIRQFIVALKALGCQFALDDFGKGMCSLSYLNSFPLDYLKIDGSFIADLHRNQVSLVMVEAIEHLASGIGLKTVAEFVENQEILDILHRLNIDYAQGFYLGRPQRLAEIVSLL
ncbi:MAG: EAL domain-containing protein [Cyanobacteria bacterium J06623_7]